MTRQRAMVIRALLFRQTPMGQPTVPTTSTLTRTTTVAPMLPIQAVKTSPQLMATVMVVTAMETESLIL